MPRNLIVIAFEIWRLFSRTSKSFEWLQTRGLRVVQSTTGILLGNHDNTSSSQLALNCKRFHRITLKTFLEKNSSGSLVSSGTYRLPEAPPFIPGGLKDTINQISGSYFKYDKGFWPCRKGRVYRHKSVKTSTVVAEKLKLWCGLPVKGGHCNLSSYPSPLNTTGSFSSRQITLAFCCARKLSSP